MFLCLGFSSLSVDMTGPKSSNSDFLVEDMLKSYHAQWSQAGRPWSSPESTLRTGFSSTGAALFFPMMISDIDINCNIDDKSIDGINYGSLNL